MGVQKIESMTILANVRWTHELSLNSFDNGNPRVSHIYVSIYTRLNIWKRLVFEFYLPLKEGLSTCNV